MIKKIKAVLKEVFGDFLGDRATDIIEESVHEGYWNDWSPGSVAIISTEHGLPSTADGNTWVMEKWFEVSDLLPGDYFCETINGAVMAVHAG